MYNKINISGLQKVIFRDVPWNFIWNDSLFVTDKILQYLLPFTAKCVSRKTHLTVSSSGGPSAIPESVL